MKQVLLIANGGISQREVEMVRPQPFDLVVAADGGTVHALNFGFKPDVVVGDFDSLPPELRQVLPRTRFIHRPSQEQCDLEKALLFCVEEKVAAVTLLGTTGRRLDHTLSNLSVLSRFDRTFALNILTPEAEIFIVRDVLELTGHPGQTVSLLPFATADGITTTGLKYPLKNESLTFGQREGISNAFSDNACRIELTSGLLFVFLRYPGSY